jgi:hypothetical protein
MKRVKTTVNYKVPDWKFCNCSRLGKPTKDMCRFCVKHGKKYICVLHNMPLDIVEGTLVKKDMACIKATAGFPSEVEDTIQVDPKTVMKMTLQEYRKAYKQFIAQSYPDSMADKLAQQMVLGGK